MTLDSQFWISLVQIIWIDILLSGDNAVVIALACRSLPETQRRWGITLGAGAAIMLRVIFASCIVYLMAVPYLKIVGSVLLFWVAIKLLIPEEEQDSEGIQSGSNLISAIKTIVIADAVMSLDNVIGIAAASHGNILLLVLGLLVSIPLIVFGSTLIIRILLRFPILVSAGGALLGYIAGEILVTDPVLIGWVEAEAPFLHLAAPIAGAVAVVLIGHICARIVTARRRRQVDLVSSPRPGAAD